VGVTDPYWYAGALLVLLAIRVVDWSRRAIRRRAATVAASSAPLRS